MAATERAEGWFRPLAKGRLEIFLKGGGTKLRCSGKESDMHELVDWFEEQTGLSVNGPDSGVWTRQRRGPKPMKGQIDLFESKGVAPEIDTVPFDSQTLGVN